MQIWDAKRQICKTINTTRKDVTLTTHSVSGQGEQGQQGRVLTNEQFFAYEDLLRSTDRINASTSLEAIIYGLREALTDAAEFIEIDQIALLVTSTINAAQVREAALTAQQAVVAPEPEVKPTPKPNKWARAASLTNTIIFMLSIDAVGISLMRLFWGHQQVMYVLAGVMALAGWLFTRMLVRVRKSSVKVSL